MRRWPVVLMYHAVGADGGMYTVTPEQLKRHLSIVGRGGFEASRASVLRDSRSPATAITFDDGDRTVVTRAMPLLSEAGQFATLFMTAGCVGEVGWCSATDLRAWCAAGNELGTHGWGHHSLTAVPIDQALDELARSKAVLEDITGTEVLSVSFPYGRLTRSLVVGARELGLSSAFGSWPGYGVGRSGAFGRYAVFRRTSEATLVRVLEGHGRVAYVPQRGLFVLSRMLGDSVYMRLRRRLRHALGRRG
jgi:peptidoglycan/xylan/chitin deacetylase (PgdA/CDA1 family)